MEPELAALPWPQRRSFWGKTGTLVVGVLGLLGLGAALLGWRSSIAPLAPATAPLQPSIYTAATVERGRQLAAVGDCAVCHTATGGATNAGGQPLHTPFGTVYSTNLTPDVETGLGSWSLAAFQRAMREGISRDGHHLYPAFPYTAFAKTSDDDLTALYAYLMAQPAVKAATPPAQMRFPFNLRPLMAGWNALFHDATPAQPVPSQSAEWNRGASLVNGLGHCGACHTPRNALGAELGGRAYLSGALVDGWEAPALTALSKSPVPWTVDALYSYLRHGHAPEHGSAAGPMAPVVRALAAVPDADIRAMATYLASFQASKQAVVQDEHATQAMNSIADESLLPNATQRLFTGACGACHHDGDGPRLLGLNVPLGLSSKLHSDRPDNLLRVMLDGIQQPAGPQVGFMPAFRHSLSDAQIAELAGYLRQRYAPGKETWGDLSRLEEAVARIRVVLP